MPFYLCYYDLMSARAFYLGLLVLGSSAVAVADVLLKKASSFSSFADFARSPWMIGAILLYAFQIAVFIYLFLSGQKLVDVGIVQIILYALIVVASSILFFHESLTTLKIIGILLGLTGIILMNL